MKKEMLLESAKKLIQPAAEAVAEYDQKRTVMVAEVNVIMLSRHDLSAMIGEGNEAMMKDNHNNHALFMESIFTNYNPEVLVKTVLWVFKSYRAHGFQVTYWPAQLNAWIKIIEKELSPASCKTILPFYQWLIVNIPAFTELSE